ncbi:hypothetical protein BOX15_Mlig006560g2 [Macrostomum lignano]|uniref:tRNA/rRNA methyltransferase SpoU type domain-containing protein n=1 Tax=Macrostomum lignano TaxID=282301 RepID=A0A267G8Z8_9PLAT|nr:hypothetical protein BOX15_Mlig006560g2 [Macrostomum lignano]
MGPLGSVSKHLKSVIRRCKLGESDFALVEGERLVTSVAKLSKSPPSYLLSTCPHLLARLRDRCRAGHRGQIGDCVLVTDRLMSQLADAATPQACLAVFPKPDPTKAAEIRQRRLDAVTSGGLRLDYSVLCWRVSDPANVGGIARLSWCLGARRLLMTPGSANPWLPKAIRAGAGAHFDLPIVSNCAEFSDASQLLSAFSRILVACSARPKDSLLLTGSRELADTLRQDAGSSICLLLGSEANGLPDELMKSLNEAAPERVTMLHVPMSDYRQTASLNVAAAAGIVLHRLYSLAAGGDLLDPVADAAADRLSSAGGR